MDFDFLAVKLGVPQYFSLLDCQMLRWLAKALQMLSFEYKGLIVFIISFLSLHDLLPPIRLRIPSEKLIFKSS